MTLPDFIPVSGVLIFFILVTTFVYDRIKNPEHALSLKYHYLYYFMGAISLFMMSYSPLGQQTIKEVSNAIVKLAEQFRNKNNDGEPMVDNDRERKSVDNNVPSEDSIKQKKKALFEGKYIYRSVPKSDSSIKTRSLIIDEEGDGYHQFIGTAVIKKYGNTEAIEICGKRQYQIALDKNTGIKVTKVDVDWGVRRMNIFAPQDNDKEGTIFLLETNNPRGKKGKNYNLAIYMGDVEPNDIDDNGNINRINGEMFYLNVHKNNIDENRNNPTWTHAEMELVRVEEFNNPIKYLDKEEIISWFKNKWFRNNNELMDTIEIVPFSFGTKSKIPEDKCFLRAR